MALWSKCKWGKVTGITSVWLRMWLQTPKGLRPYWEMLHKTLLSWREKKQQMTGRHPEASAQQTPFLSQDRETSTPWQQDRYLRCVHTLSGHTRSRDGMNSWSHPITNRHDSGKHRQHPSIKKMPVFPSGIHTTGNSHKKTPLPSCPHELLLSARQKEAALSKRVRPSHIWLYWFVLTKQHCISCINPVPLSYTGWHNTWAWLDRQHVTLATKKEKKIQNNNLKKGLILRLNNL